MLEVESLIDRLDDLLTDQIELFNKFENNLAEVVTVVNEIKLNEALE